MTYNGYANEDSYYFDEYWSNSESLYRAIVQEGKRLLTWVPGMTDQTLGLNILNRLRAAINNGGWGYQGVPKCFVSVPPQVWTGLQAACNLQNVNETEFGANVREAVD